MSIKHDKGITKKGLLVKITITTSIFVLFSILVLATLSTNSLKNLSLNTAIQTGESKLKDDVVSFVYIIATEYGQLTLKDSDLFDKEGNSLYHQYDIVDRISKDFGVVATIFVRDKDDFRRISTSITDNTGKRIVDTMLGSTSAAYSSMMSGKDYLGRALILGKDYLTAYHPVFAANSKDIIGIFFIGIEMSAIIDPINASRNKEIIKIIVVAVIILLLSVLLNSFASSKMIIKPVNSTVDMLKEISEGEGDLTKQLSVSSKDEIGSMAHYFNQVLDKIKRMVIKIEQEVEILRGNGDDLASNMNKTAVAMNEITVNLQNIKGRVLNQSASVTETNATMEQITLNINKLNDSIDRQSSGIDRSSSAIEEMTANIQSVTNTLIKNTENIQELLNASETGKTGLQGVAADIQEIARESEGLLEINTVMQNIASQTNLLSMNAAIEAAHAGEAGKGFAVVADEIRKLATSSNDQSKTISTVLKKMKNAIDNISASTGSVLNQFGAIDSAVKIVAEQNVNIRNAMEEQSEGSKQILDTISQLNDITRQVKDGSVEMQEGSKEVIKEGQNLEKIAVEITDGMSEIAVGADQISLAVNQVNELSNKNQDNISNLKQEISKFKVR